MIAGGRAWIRSVLYMSTVVAVRRNPILKEFYERLRAKGKRWSAPAPLLCVGG
jgi:transposase